jgi:hypothetical protein
VLAGANRVTRAAQPPRPLFHGGFGSILIAARREYLGLGKDPAIEWASTSPRAEVVLGNNESATTLGATWHLNQWVAIEGNVIREDIGKAGVAMMPHLQIWSRLLRVQLAI